MAHYEWALFLGIDEAVSSACSTEARFPPDQKAACASLLFETS
jgi:hypothetical protein